MELNDLEHSNDLPQVKTVADPNDPPWSFGIATLVWLASLAAIIFIPGMILTPYILTSGVDLADNKALGDFAMSDQTAILIQIAGVIPAHLLTLLIAWFVVTGAGKRPFFASLGWSNAGVKWWHYILMLLGFMIVSMLFISIFPLQPDQMDTMIKSSRNALYLISFMAVVTAPLVEEVVYRGVMYSAFQRTIGMAAAVVLVSLLFTSVHIPQYFENPAKILVIFTLSIGLTLLRGLTGSLLPSVIFHTLINGTQSALSIAEPYINPTAEAINNLPK